MSDANHVWRLLKRPAGGVSEGDLSFETESVPEPADGQALVRLNYLSVDPTNLVWMSRDSYIPAVPLDAPMRGVVCGTVVASLTPELPAGAVVSGLGEWADYQLATPETVSVMGDTGRCRWPRRSGPLPWSVPRRISA